MAINKKQHYVPKCYLKHFSNDQDEKTITIYSINNKSFIEDVPIKNQAQEDYFYSKDLRYEELLALIEDSFSKTLDQIKKTKTLPKRDSDDDKYLKIFTLLMPHRTKENVERVYRMLKVTREGVFKNDDRFKDMFNEAEYIINDPGLYSLKIGLKAIKMGFDLETKLIVNESDVRFITSDHPVFKYNQFMESRNYEHGALGLGTKGLQVFFPLTPSLLLVLYDRKVYRVGNKKDKVIVVKNSYDVQQLNDLLFINSGRIIFFNKEVKKDYLTRTHNRVQKFLNREKETFKEVSSEENNDGTTSTMMHFTRHDARTKLDISFISQTKNAKKYVFNDYVIQLRDEGMREKMNEYY